MRNSAPLPDDWDIKLPQPGLLHADIVRAATELRWALHRQRAAWRHMARLKSMYDTTNVEFIDNERSWKLATGEVSWWRGEVTSRATALTAMLNLAEQLGCPLPRYAETTRPGATQRAYIPTYASPDEYDTRTMSEEPK